MSRASVDGAVGRMRRSEPRRGAGRVSGASVNGADTRRGGLKDFAWLARRAACTTPRR
ncbi:MAG: hypothetical protein KIT31_38415 [Deltaproteobacteria bacterium]|nr:hypothetical protein [Deltaproteobacteria bacterium]